MTTPGADTSGGPSPAAGAAVPPTPGTEGFRPVPREWIVRPYVIGLLVLGCGVATHELAYLIRIHFPLFFYRSMDPRPIGWILPAIGLVQLACFWLLGLLQDPRDRIPLPLVGRTFIAALLVEVLLLAALGNLKLSQFPRSLSLVAFPLDVIGTATALLLVRRIAHRRTAVLLIGNDENQIRNVQEKLAGSPRLAGSRFIPWILPADEVGRLPGAGTQQRLRDLIRETGADEVVLVHQDAAEESLLPALCLLGDSIRRLYVVPSLRDVILARNVRGFIAGDVRMLEVSCPLDHPDAAFAKRLIDVSLAFALLVLLLPAMAAVSLLILFSSGRPVLYSQTRVGRRGRPFRLYKFRTMVPEAERDSGAVVSWEGDPRITRVGRFLRACRLDEMPQLWNVLAGSMSLVGPRPERPELVEQIEREIPGYSIRHRVKPGLTGLAQVHALYASSPMEKLRFDLAYLYNYTPALDVYLAFRTLLTILSASGR